ncbi:MAG: PspC domain-containing protein [Propionibacterium sp.]
MSDHKLARSRDHRMIAGVAGGLGEYLNIDANIVRLVFIIVGLFTLGTAVVAYAAGWLLLPDEQDGVRGFDEILDRIKDFKNSHDRHGDTGGETFDPYSEK